MPYEIRGKTVVKKDTGKVVGHSNNPKAYMKALYANSKDMPHKHQRREK